MSAHRVCFRVEISCCIFKRGPLKNERRSTGGQISHFLTPVKLEEGWARSLGCDVKLSYDRTSRIDLMAVVCATSEKNALVKKKLENVAMHCNLRQPDAAQSLSALIRRPRLVLSRGCSGVMCSKSV